MGKFFARHLEDVVFVAAMLAIVGVTVWVAHPWVPHLFLGPSSIELPGNAPGGP